MIWNSPSVPGAILLSNKLELFGITLYPNDIYLIEKGQRIVKDFELMAICEILEIDTKKIKEKL